MISVQDQSITVTVEVHLDGNTREYKATKDTLPLARYEAEKKARAYLRRQNLSVKMPNVVKERCEDCPELTVITVHDLDVPPRVTDDADDFDWLLAPERHM